MEAGKKKISKRIPSRTESLADVREFIDHAARKYGFSEDDIASIILAVDEACTNIIKHAYQYAADKEIEISIFPGTRSFEIRIYDNGNSFDPSQIRPPDLKEHLGHKRRGGLGVYLMKRLMDKVEYNYIPGKRNEVRLIKYRMDSTAQARR
ncbi:MAG: ATP-binding protein [Bacteroidetes bacterium]|nr:ATP-binding protein [Bacteroidota bacterium]